MEPLTLHQVTASCAGELRRGDGDVQVRRVNIDSRQSQAGDLFVGIRGDRFDGHEFVADAVRGGATAVLGELNRVRAPLPDCPLINVRDSRRALGDIASAYRHQFELPVVAVAGSNGKTTTKELIAAVLQKRFITLASEASFNNDIGVPLTLLRLERRHQAAVLEAGTNHPGELRPLLGMIQPTLGVLTGIGREHLEFFGDLEGVTAEEGWLAEMLPPGGVLYMNGDTPGGEEVVRRTRARVVRVGWHEGSDWQAESLHFDASGTTFRVVAPRPEWSGEYRLRLLGRHQAGNALLAVALAAELGLTRDEVEQGLAACESPRMRLQLREVNGIQLLEDCYNANADSVLAALETLGALPCAGRRIAVLGEMGELGAQSEAAHAEVGRATAQGGVDCLIAVGRMAGVVARAARSAGLNDVCEVADGEVASALAGERVMVGDVVLVKASRAARLECVGRRLAEGGKPMAEGGKPMAEGGKPMRGPRG